MKLERGQYYGHTIKTFNVNGIILTQTAYRQKESIPQHYHLNPYFCYVLQGGYLERSIDKELMCESGDLLFHSANTEHSNCFSHTSSLCFNIELEKQFTNKFFQTDFSGGSIFKIKERVTEVSMLKLLYEMNNSDGLSHLMIEGLILEAFVQLNRSKEKFIPFYLKTVLEYIHEEYTINPTLSQIAEVANTSPEHLVREFRKKFNTTIGMYVRQIKIKKACEFLSLTNKEISSIAFELGFSDQSHFTKVFKSITGVTPFQYRSKI